MAESAADIRNRRPPPAPTTTAEGPKPLGVPEDYEAPGKFGVTRGGGFGGRAPTSFGMQVPALYMKGDEWRPAGLTPDQIAELQQEMVDAGLLTGKFRIGVWDADSRAAYTELLETANASGATAPEALAAWKAGLSMEDPDEGRTKRAPLTVNLSNPDSLAAVFRKAARRVQGGEVDEATIDRMIWAYQGIETAGQTKAYAMGGDEFGDNQTGGTIVDPIDPTTFAEQQAREVNPLKADARDVVRKFAMLKDMLGPGGVMQASGDDA